MIKIFTDSTAYIPDDLRKEYDITIIPLTITLNGRDYLETELPNETFYKIAEETNSIPKISAPSQEYVENLFKREVMKGNRIVGIFISSKISALYSLAENAKKAIIKQIPGAKIHFIDSETNTMHMGLAVLAAAEANRQGQWLENVVAAAYEIMKRSRYLFIPARLKYLGKVGNIEKRQAFVGDLMQVRPILSPVKGEVEPMETIITQKKALARLIEMVKEDVKIYGLTRMVICHINAEKKALELKKQLSPMLEEEIMISAIGPSIGYYIGPGTIGIVYQTEDVHPLNEHIHAPKFLD